jgi:hypothetical protein
MSARARRLAITVGSLGFVALGVACVDLFHSTDFDTLCTKSPDAPACGANDGAAADVVDGDIDAGPAHPNFCAWTSEEARTQAARACAWLGACERPLGESLFGACVVHAQLAFDCALNPSLRPRLAIDAFWACLATVKTCGDVDRCIFPAGVQECIAVPSGSSTACGTAGNSGVRLECTGPAGRAHGIEPCALSGQTCSPNGPSLASCSGVLGFACTTTNGACSGTSAIDCQPSGVRNVDQGIDCSGYGAGKCALGEAGPACTPTKTATTCLEDTPPVCDGALVRTCLAGEDVRIDCAKLDLPCDVTGVSTADPTAGCIKRGAGACTASDICPTPTTLRSCGRGARYDVDCTAAGLGKCAIDNAGHGACTPPP